MATGILDAGGSSTAGIQYATQRNQLASQKAGEEMSVARVQVVKTYSLTEIGEQMEERGGIATRATILYVLQELTDTIEKLLAKGNACDLGGLVKLTPVIRGVFKSGELFNADKHTIVISAQAGKVIRGAAKAGPTTKIGGSVSPTIESVKNTVTFEDGILFGLTTATIKGKNLGFDALASDEGLFIDANGVGVEVIEATATEIHFRLTGEVESETAAVLTFKTRGGDKNAEPIGVAKSVTLKPAE